MNTKKAFAEVISSSLPSWRAQTWIWNDMPTFGSLVIIRSQERTIFGLVYHIEMGSLDTHRTVYAYQKTEEELQHEQPQIFEFLHTTFSCLTVGYEQDNTLYYQLAPEPPKIHAFVQRATKETITAFFESDQFLHLIFNAPSHLFGLDELLLALLKQLSQHGLLTPEKLTQFIETFSLLTANDYRRLKLFLQRAHPIINVIV